jgi:DNA-directed RNA polymerase subunit RPC12/RpoP
MIETSFKFDPSCSKCGSDALIGPDDMTDESTITCETCGADLGTLGELKIAAFRLAKEKFAEEQSRSIGKAFEGADDAKFIKPGY